MHVGLSTVRTIKLYVLMASDNGLFRWNAGMERWFGILTTPKAACALIANWRKNWIIFTSDAGEKLLTTMIILNINSLKH